MDEDQYLAFLVAALTDTDLDECSAKSKYVAAQKCAGLRLVPQLGHVALIPRWSKADGCKVVNVSPQWQGFKSVMERSPQVLEVRPMLVHIRDRYQFSNGVMQHEYDPFDPERVIRSVKDIRGGYVTVLYTDGRPPVYHTVTAEYIEKCMGCADTDKVWSKWFEQQALKTLIRSAFARRVVSIDPMYEGILADVSRADDAAMDNDPLRSANAVEAPKAATSLSDLTQRMESANALPDNPLLDEPVAAIPATPASAPKRAPRKGRKGRKSSSATPEPVEQTALERFTATLSGCNTIEEANDLWTGTVEFAKELTDDEVATASVAFQKRLNVLRGKVESEATSEATAEASQSEELFSK